MENVKLDLIMPAVIYLFYLNYHTSTMKERDMGVSLALLYFFIVYVSGFVVKLAPISLKKSTFLKNQDNVIYDSETMQKLTTQLLLEQEKATKSSRNDNDDEHDEDDVTVKTFSFSFKAKHTHKIQLPGIELADMYLSLPASEYSILSSSLISRSPTSEKNNTFILSIPLGDYRVIDATLQAEVIVDPQPSSCRVLMESSNIVFLPTNVMKKRASGDVMGSYSSLSDDLRSKVINSNNLSEAVEIILESGEVDDDAPISNYIVAPPIGEWLGVEVNSTGSSSNISGSADSGNSLPNWLIWGGEGPVGKESDGGVLSNATGPGENHN